MFGWHFFNCWFSIDAIRTKFSTNFLNTLHKSRKDLNSVRLVAVMSSQIVFVICDASSKGLGRITWPR